MTFSINIQKEINLDDNLFNKQGSIGKDKRNIVQLHHELALIEELMKITTSIEELKLFNNLWYSKKKLLQSHLNFKENINYIKFWKVPKCICRKNENENLYPNGNYVINSNCLLHGLL
jgi:hypothetical protein